MRTKCPYCDVGCSRCDDGFFESLLGDGAIFSESCTNDGCRFVSGIWVVSKGKPLPEDERRCALCGWTSEWLLFGWSAPDPERDDPEDPETDDWNA